MAEDQASQDIASETDAQPADDFDKARAMATIAKLREFEKQSKAQAKELDELRAARKATEDATLSETEKLRKHNQELEAAVQAREAALVEREAAISEQRRANLAQRQAASLGAYDPADANILSAVATIDPASENAEQAIKEALEGLRKAKPYLFKASGQVAAFAPTGTNQPESDAQRVARVLSHSRGGGYGPLG